MGEVGVVDTVRRVLSRHEPEYADRILAGGWDESGLARIVADAVREGAAETEFQPVAGAGLEFGAALAVLRGGGRVARAGWNGRGMFVFHVSGVTGGSGPGMRPYLALRTVDGDVVPWVASQTDLLASDWAVKELTS